jgi:glycosyltransferase involved in cell wall biosynthesis
MKIAVYTIALNEEKFVERWYESAKDADYLLIADTGSTDATRFEAMRLGINVVRISVNPWRFDDARNAALAALPDDIDMCISLDMDEVLSEGWREKLETATGTQIEYKYTQSWRDKDQKHPQIIFPASKVHARHGYRWKYIVHEYIFPDRNPKHETEFLEGFEIYHKADDEKSRDSYNGLIEDAYNEEPDNDRYVKYHAFALAASDDKAKAIKVLKRFIDMPKKFTAESDISHSYILLSKLEPEKQESYLKKAISLFPQLREPIVLLAVHYFLKEEWKKCEKYCKQALEITTRRLDYNYGEFAWSYLPGNMLKVSSYNKALNKDSDTYEQDTWKMNVASIISTNFEIFKDDDVL